jgi:putative phosphonate metabolism protein
VTFVDVRMPNTRYAIYYTPPPDSPFARFGAGVLGYDCFERAEVSHRSIDGLNASLLALATVEPRRYGFHATLVAPFRLAPGSNHDALAIAFSAFATSCAPVMAGPLRVAAMGRFIALVPAEPYPEIEALADACVAAFDRFRAPLTDADRARRLAAGLSPRQTELLERWGYPYVLDEFRFHMTLAGPIVNGERTTFKTNLTKAFSHLAHDHLELGAISLMRQDDPADAFYVLSRQRLTGLR